MKKHRVWLEIFLLGTAIACAIALLFAGIGFAAGVAVGQTASPEQPPATAHTYEGMISCSRCGAKHSPALGKTADVCVRICVHDGASFALVGADSMYILNGDLNTLKRLAGQRVRVVGDLSGNTIRATSVEADM